jgi:hypothetical protein
VLSLGENVYAFIVPYDEKLDTSAAGAPFATMAVWAETSGAVRRALLREIEADVASPDQLPPEELMLAPEVTAYGGLLAAARRAGMRVLEYAAYRVATDGVFVHRAIDCGRFVYCFEAVGRTIRSDRMRSC